MIKPHNHPGYLPKEAPEAHDRNTAVPLSSVVFFPATSLPLTTSFYVDAVGFSIYHQTDKSVIVDTGYGYLGFVEYGHSRPSATGICISLNCASRSEVDQIYNSMKTNYTIEFPPRQHEHFPVYSFFMSDPNGYTLEFQIIEALP